MPAADFPPGLRTDDRVSSSYDDDGFTIIHIFEFDNNYGAKVWGKEGDTYWAVALTKNDRVIRTLTGLPRMPHDDPVANVNSILEAIDEAPEGSWTIPPPDIDSGVESWVGLTDEITADEAYDALETRIVAGAEEVVAGAGGPEVAYAESQVGASLYLTTTPLANDNNIVLVDGDGKAHWLEYGIALRVVVGGQGQIVARLYEVIDGVAVSVGGDSPRQYLTAQPATSAGGTHVGKIRVDPSDEDKMYVLYGNHVQEGSSFAGAFHNLASLPTWLRAAEA